MSSADEPVVIDAADLPVEIGAMHGFWLTPIDDEGHPDGPTTYHPIPAEDTP